MKNNKKNINTVSAFRGDNEFLFLALPDESCDVNLQFSSGPSKAQCYTSEFGEVFLKTTALVSVHFMETKRDDRVKLIPESVLELMCDCSEEVVGPDEA
nr:hypothetical protein [uncultured Pseudodesulfovibrio sp.]